MIPTSPLDRTGGAGAGDDMPGDEQVVDLERPSQRLARMIDHVRIAERMRLVR